MSQSRRRAAVGQLPEFRKLRNAAISRLKGDLIRLRPGSRAPNFADAGTNRSVKVAKKLIEVLECNPEEEEIGVQTIGTKFASLVCQFLEQAFSFLGHVRPGNWKFSTAQPKLGIAEFDQYEHLADLNDLLADNQNLKAALGSAYLIKPDITVARLPLSEAELNAERILVDNDERVARHSPLRAINRDGASPSLHACVSCKWTMRSDRAQNSRTEALNLIRNRKGHVPRISLVTFEPTVNIIASMALGTGDLDCVYHPTLPELTEAVTEAGLDDALEMLQILVQGRRLRDLSDLPFDLAL